MLGACNTTVAALQAGNVFLAIANPEIDDQSGRESDYGRQLGPAMIVAHAPFVAASCALIPVVAPSDAFHDPLVDDDMRAPGPGAENSWQALRGRGRSCGGSCTPTTTLGSKVRRNRSTKSGPNSAPTAIEPTRCGSSSRWSSADAKHQRQTYGMRCRRDTLIRWTLHSRRWRISIGFSSQVSTNNRSICSGCIWHSRTMLISSNYASRGSVRRSNAMARTSDRSSMTTDVAAYHRKLKEDLARSSEALATRRLASPLRRRTGRKNAARPGRQAMTSTGSERVSRVAADTV